MSHERPSFANKFWGRPARILPAMIEILEIADLALSIFNYTEKSQRRMPILDASFSLTEASWVSPLKLCMAFALSHA